MICNNTCKSILNTLQPALTKAPLNRVTIVQNYNQCICSKNGHFLSKIVSDLMKAMHFEEAGSLMLSNTIPGSLSCISGISTVLANDAQLQISQLILFKVVLHLTFSLWCWPPTPPALPPTFTSLDSDFWFFISWLIHLRVCLLIGIKYYESH